MSVDYASFGDVTSGSVDISTTLRQRIKSSSASLTYRAVVVGHQLAPPDETQFKTFASTFLSVESTAEDVLKVSTRGYDDIPELASSSFAEIVSKRKYFMDGQSGIPAAVDAVLRLTALQGAMDKIKQVWDHYGVQVSDTVYTRQKIEIANGLQTDLDHASCRLHRQSASPSFCDAFRSN